MPNILMQPKNSLELSESIEESYEYELGNARSVVLEGFYAENSFNSNKWTWYTLMWSKHYWLLEKWSQQSSSIDVVLHTET